MQTKRLNGKQAESLVCAYLKQQGMHILDRNFRCRQGEIDIIGREDSYLVFIEVKARFDKKSGYPAEALTKSKQEKICRAAMYYCFVKEISADVPIRFDVVEILGDRIRHLKNAFEYHI